jgi:hypothetical protein
VIPHPADVLSAELLDAVDMPNAIVNGITIDYSMVGVGPPLLTFGTGQPADPWFAQVTDLAAAGSPGDGGACAVSPLDPVGLVPHVDPSRGDYADPVVRGLAPSWP